MNGVDPRAAGKMSIYELFSTFAKIPKDDGRPMSDSEFDVALDSIRMLNLPDVRI